MTAQTSFHATANRADICQLLGFGRTTWHTYAGAADFPKPNGYANRWPTYSIASVAHWLYKNHPRHLLKTDFGRDSFQMISRDESGDKAGGVAVFADKLGMDAYEFEQFLDEFEDVYDAAYYGEFGQYWTLAEIYTVAIGYHRNRLADMQRMVANGGDDSWIVPTAIETIPRVSARIVELAAEAEQHGVDVSEEMAGFTPL